MLNILSPYGHTDSYFEIHLTAIGIASVKKTLGGEDVEKEQPLFAAGRRAIQFSHVKLLVEASPRPKNCMTQLPTPGHGHRGFYQHGDTYTHMSLAALVTVIRKGSHVVDTHNRILFSHEEN